VNRRSFVSAAATSVAALATLGTAVRATNELVRAHGATPLLVVLQFGHEEQAEQMLRRRILDDAGLPYLLIEIDSAWRLPWDRHPNARAAHAIANAIASQLRPQIPAVDVISDATVTSARKRATKSSN
jgi:hypothetical protein